MDVMAGDCHSSIDTCKKNLFFFFNSTDIFSLALPCINIYMQHYKILAHEDKLMDDKGSLNVSMTGSITCWFMNSSALDHKPPPQCVI